MASTLRVDDQAMLGTQAIHIGIPAGLLLPLHIPQTTAANDNAQTDEYQRERRAGLLGLVLRGHARLQKRSRGKQRTVVTIEAFELRSEADVQVFESRAQHGT